MMENEPKYSKSSIQKALELDGVTPEGVMYLLNLVDDLDNKPDNVDIKKAYQLDIKLDTGFRVKFEFGPTKVSGDLTDFSIDKHRWTAYLVVHGMLHTVPSDTIIEVIR